MANLEVVEIRGAAAFDTLRNEWQTLFRAAGASPFLTFEWLSTWHEWLGSGREPLLLCAREDGQLVGLLPLAVEERRLWKCFGKLQRLSFLGEAFGGADYLDVIALPERRAAVSALLFDHLAQRGGFDLLELEGFATDSPNFAALLARFSAAASFNVRQTPHYTCPQVELNSDWPTFLANSRRRDNFKQKLRRIRQRYEFDYRVVTEAAEIEAAFERYYKLHENRWAGHGGSDATGHARLREFQRAAVSRLAATGLLRFEELWIDGECRASNYGLDDGVNFYFYSAGYDQAWRNMSPGLVLTGLSIESAIQRGLKRFDFLRGDETYKFDWANATRETVTLTIAQRNLVSTLFVEGQRAWNQLRVGLKEALPAPVALTLRNWFRLARRQQSLATSNS
jgi:CelD/BcsL family acetyltransferase involved in cellulose biosynthesis